MNRNIAPKVSVVIPSYNHGEFIGKAIDSVLAQTFTDFEIIIVDDASTDDSSEKIKCYKDRRIKFYKLEKNLGAVFTLNYCIKNTCGKYIALLNSDDMWEPEKLEIQVDFLDRNSHIGAVFTNATFIGEDGRVLEKSDFFWVDAFEKENLSSGKWLRRLFFELNCLCHPSILIRKEVYDRTKLYNPCFRQLPDYYMWIEILKFTSIFVIAKKLVKFRILSSVENTSAVTVENRIRNINEIFLIIKNYFKDIPSDIFVEGFSDLFKKKGELSKEEVLCEQAFMFFQVNSEIDYIYRLVGIEKLFILMQNRNTNFVLKNSYNFDDKEFFKLTGNEYNGVNNNQTLCEEIEKMYDQLVVEHETCNEKLLRFENSVEYKIGILFRKVFWFFYYKARKTSAKWNFKN